MDIELRKRWKMIAALQLQRLAQILKKDERKITTTTKLLQSGQ